MKWQHSFWQFSTRSTWRTSVVIKRKVMKLLELNIIGNWLGSTAPEWTTMPSPSWWLLLPPQWGISRSPAQCSDGGGGVVALAQDGQTVAGKFSESQLHYGHRVRWGTTRGNEVYSLNITRPQRAIIFVVFERLVPGKTESGCFERSRVEPEARCVIRGEISSKNNAFEQTCGRNAKCCIAERICFSIFN